MGQTGAWRLSPAYDLSFSDGPGGEHHLSINGNGLNPTVEDLQAVGQGAGLRPRRISAIMAELTETVAKWEVYANESGVPRPRRDEIAARMASVYRWPEKSEHVG
jgi:serine/threonine-protein kinase HipA